MRTFVGDAVGARAREKCAATDATLGDAMAAAAGDATGATAGDGVGDAQAREKCAALDAIRGYEGAHLRFKWPQVGVSYL